MIELTRNTLDPEKVTAKVRRDTNGAVVTFLGTTRDNFEGKTVLTLEYEAFEEMAVKKLEEVRQELMAEFGLEQVAISHRIGTVGIGEISLVVAIGSPHRKDAFFACHKAVDLASKLTQAGALVDVIMTRGATNFATPLAFQSITHRPVLTDAFDPSSASAP
ncbi:MAG: molybdenum cofactor biosynthesis protein MoaE [Chloroflexi bacterium]|nr:molybdenum cofactor biosynthesis protein MoaE [Chloroflexota bacterium]